MRILPDSAKYGGLGFILICVFSIMISGCGEKMFPRPQGGVSPPQVSDLKAQVVSRSVELSWSPVSPEAAKKISYAIMKSEIKWENRNCLECPVPDQQRVQNIEGAAAKPGADGKLRWVDTDVSFHRAFHYQIILNDDRGNIVSVSNPVTAKVYPGPAAPVNITASTEPQGVLIQWRPVLKDIEGKNLEATSVSFLVEKLSGEKGWEKASPSSVKGDVYYDQAVAPGQRYTYRVVPVLFIDGTYIHGEPSSTVMVSGPESAPPPPPGRVWITPAHGALEIHWTESDGKTAGYHVYRREGTEIIRLTASPVQHPPYLDQGVKKGATYSYAVSAVSSRGDHKEGLLSKWIEVRNLFGE
jgi:hypothetical protein